MLRYFALALMLFAGPAVAQQARPAAANWVNTVVKTPEGYRQGNPDAPIKIVEYGSRTCPTCGMFAAQGVEPLRREWIATGKASYEFRDLLIHGAPDFALALLNQCVPTQRFFPILDAMFANQGQFGGALNRLLNSQPKTIEAWQQLPPGQMATKFAEGLGALPFMRARGVTDAQARQCLNNPATIRAIGNVQKGAAEQGINSTPTFFINGRRVRAYTWDQLQPELRAAE